MIWDIFKTKKVENNINPLQKELEDFTAKYKEYFNSYAFDGKNMIIYKKLEIIDDKLVLNYINENTPKNYCNYSELWKFESIYGSDFMRQHRNNYIRLKHQLQQLGLVIEKPSEVITDKDKEIKALTEFINTLGKSGGKLQLELKEAKQLLKNAIEQYITDEDGIEEIEEFLNKKRSGIA